MGSPKCLQFILQAPWICAKLCWADVADVQMFISLDMWKPVSKVKGSHEDSSSGDHECLHKNAIISTACKNLRKKLPQPNSKQLSFDTGSNNSTVATSSKHWKWLPADETFTQEKFNIKNQIFEGVKATDKDFSDNTGAVTTENKTLTRIVENGFVLMRSVISRCWYAAASHYPTQPDKLSALWSLSPKPVIVVAWNPITQQQNIGPVTSTQWSFNDKDNESLIN